MALARTHRETKNSHTLPRKNFGVRSSTGEGPAEVPINLGGGDIGAGFNTFNPRPYPLESTSLTASALRIKEDRIKRARDFTGASGSDGWQTDAWDMYDLVGEQRFLSNTLANRMSQARLFVGKIHGNDTEEPEPVEDENVNAILQNLGGTASARTQIIRRLGLSLFIAGEGWLVGVSPDIHPDTEKEQLPADNDRAVPVSIDNSQQDSTPPSVEDFVWSPLSVAEVKFSQDKVTLTLGSAGETIEVSPDDVYLIRVWRPHPKQAWLADSPTRSSLPILRELVGLTQHISAQVDSRLAGAGLLLIPSSASEAFKQSMDSNPLEESGFVDQDGSEMFTEALIDAMLTPIGDRSSASAIVPLVVTVPDDSVEHFKHIAFSQPLDLEARELRDEAIRRLALGQDAPPELLLGVGTMNHWGAWLVKEDVVTTHLEPPLALICDALTTQYLWPLLKAQGMAEEQVKEHVIWYDVSHMIVRPNKGGDALELFDRGIVGPRAVRDAQGFEESDSPEAEALRDEESGASEESTAVDPGRALAVETAIDLVRAAPTLLQSISLTDLVEQIENVLTGKVAEIPTPDEESTGGSGEGGLGTPVEADGTIPTTSEDPAPADDDMGDM